MRPGPVVANPTVKFPEARYETAASYIAGYTSQLEAGWRTLDADCLDRAAVVLLDAYTRRAGVFSCGNGGSASIANHLVCDHTKGVGNSTDLLPRVVSLSNNVEVLTAIANDLAYEDIFAHQLQSQAEPGDVLVAISSSGRSANIVRALAWARDHDVRTVALTGFDGGQARTLADVAIHFPVANYGVVEDLHQAAMHALAQFIRQSRMTPGLIAESVF